MRITRLFIPEYKNLRQFEFTPTDSGSQVVIGQNASGKSNLIEVLISIFRHLDLGEESPFDYEIEFNCRGNKTEVVSQNDNTIIKVKEGSKRKRTVVADDFTRKASEYLPDHIFAYYSGRNQRVEQLFFEHQWLQYLKYRGELVENDKTNDSSLQYDDVPLR